MLLKTILNDTPFPWQLGFQNPGTSIMEGIINFHHDLFFFIVVIIVFVYYMLARCVYIYQDKKDNRKPINVTHASTLEIVWTLVPAIILFLIALPSFSLLYSMDEMIQPLMTVKIVGNQWYWHYELIHPYKGLSQYFSPKSKVGVNDTANVPSFSSLKSQEFATEFDSYMILDEDIKKGQHRLLDVDNKLYLPTRVNIRLLVTANDVLHSWAVPAFGVKLDSVPGRLNQTMINIKRASTFYGQCSEICGVNHAFMPIVVQSIDWKFKSEITQDLFNLIYPIFITKYYRPAN
ncbi:cytochrome c oxidase subunit II [Candidatus Woesearchaeota archaeon]|nr:cytochrome c oxidase subunit II [Candidatus Woesearchaeota archaeon]